MTFSVIEKLTQLRDVLTAGRADGRLLAWSDTDDAHVYIDPPEGGSGGGSPNLDGGRPDSNYGGTTAIDGGTP